MTQRASVVIPAYDAEATLGATLEALAAQQGLELRLGEPLEIIVVDDGSHDRTAQIARDAGDSRAIVVRQTNAGPGAARNAGVAAARGDIILFTDSDCVPTPTWVSAMLSAFDDERIALVVGRTLTASGDGYLALAKQGSDAVGRCAGPATRFNSNNLALRAEIARALPFDETLRIYGEDTDLGWRALQAGHATWYTPDAVVEHCHRHDARSFLRDGWLQGRGAARLHYKHRRAVPRDLLFAVLGLALLALAALAPVLRAPASWAAAASFGLFGAALLWAELYYKGKTPSAALLSLPAQLAWYGCKLAGYLAQCGRIALRLEPSLRHSRQARELEVEPAAPRGEY